MLLHPLHGLIDVEARDLHMQAQESLVGTCGQRTEWRQIHPGAASECGLKRGMHGDKFEVALRTIPDGNPQPRAREPDDDHLEREQCGVSPQAASFLCNQLHDGNITQNELEFIRKIRLDDLSTLGILRVQAFLREADYVCYAR